MVSTELIRRYPFFAGLTLEQVSAMASAASEENVEAGHFFLHEKDETPYLYLVIEGEVTVVSDFIPARRRPGPPPSPGPL